MHTPRSSDTEADSGGIAGPEAQNKVSKAPEETISAALPLQEALQRAEQAQEALLRARADLENLRRRSLKDKADAVQAAQAKLMESLLPVLDQFELGLAAAQSSAQLDQIKQGFVLIFNYLRQTLIDQGLHAVPPPQGLPDPHMHECVGQEPTTQVQEGEIVRTTRTGYRFGERLLRPASVIVAKAKP